MKNDTRFPYTYACDYLRQFGGNDSGGVKMSRSDASQVRQAVAKALGMDDEELARKLAIYYKENEQELSDQAVSNLMARIDIREASNAG